MGRAEGGEHSSGFEGNRRVSFFLKVLSAVQLAGQTLTNSVCMAVSFPPNGSILLLFAT